MTGERLGLENDFLLILLCFCFRFWDLVDMSDLHYRGLSLGYTDISFVYLKLCVCVCVCVRARALDLVSFRYSKNLS